MTISLEELSGGLAREKDMVLAGQPDDSEMRESVSAWFYDENGELGFPRVGIEAEARSWLHRRLQFALTAPGGRALNGAGMGPAPSAIGPTGEPTDIGAGGLLFRSIEPFRRWTIDYDGDAIDGTVEQQIADTYGKNSLKRVRLHLDMEIVTPAWVQEYAITEGMSQIEKDNAAAMGLGYRIENHFRATGTLEVGGKTRDFKATGTRIHRQSVRHLTGFYGHCWLSALFPNGDAFGCLTYPPRGEDKETYSYNDAVIYKNGKQVVAKVIKAPFLRNIVPEGDDVSVELESEFGRTVIEGKTLLSTFRVNNPDIGGLNMQQSGARFTWDGQSTYGMVERSTHESLTRFG
jgi:hypothetical protein